MEVGGIDGIDIDGADGSPWKSVELTELNEAVLQNVLSHAEAQGSRRMT